MGWKFTLVGENNNDQGDILDSDSDSGSSQILSSGDEEDNYLTAEDISISVEESVSIDIEEVDSDSDSDSSNENQNTSDDRVREEMESMIAAESALPAIMNSAAGIRRERSNNHSDSNDSETVREFW